MTTHPTPGRSRDRLLNAPLATQPFTDLRARLAKCNGYVDSAITAGHMAEASFWERDAERIRDEMRRRAQARDRDDFVAAAQGWWVVADPPAPA